VNLVSMPLSQLATVQSGGGAPQDTAAFSTTGFPFVRAGSLPKLLDGMRENSLERIEPDIAQRYGLKLFPAGTVLFAKSGMSATKGYVYRLKNPAYVVSHLAALIPYEPNDSAFLVRALQRFSPTVLIKDPGYPSIRLSDIEMMRIKVPTSLNDRMHIGEILDKADVLRAMHRAALAQLGALTQSIFINMFGDPVSNPKGWPNPSVGGLLTYQQYGPRFYNESYSVEGVRVVRITDLNEAGVLDFSSMPRYNVTTEDREKYLLHPGDLIFARSGATVGKTALIQPDSPPCIAGAYFITMRFDPKIDPCYAQAVLSSPSVRSIVAKRSRQAAQQNFSGPGLRQLPMPCPPIELQHEFVCRIEALQKLKNSQLASLAKLDTLFASLQQRAFMGEL